MTDKTTPTPSDELVQRLREYISPDQVANNLTEAAVDAIETISVSAREGWRISKLLEAQLSAANAKLAAAEQKLADIYASKPVAWITGSETQCDMRRIYGGKPLIIKPTEGEQG